LDVRFRGVARDDVSPSIDMQTSVDGYALLTTNSSTNVNAEGREPLKHLAIPSRKSMR